MSEHHPLAVIDSHHHLWALARGDYDWLSPELGALYKDFGLDGYGAVTKHYNIQHAVVVQAAATNEETDYLLSLAQISKLPVAVVGWVDFESDQVTVTGRLEELALSPEFRGVRPMLQDIDDVDWIINPDFTPIFEQLVKLNLCFDALIRPEHLDNIAAIAKRFPSLRIVINHCAKPDIANNEYLRWARGIAKFTSLKNVFIKVSGLTLQGKEEQQDAIYYQQYFNHVLSTFSADRMMWGSDWPVVNLMSDFAHWFDISKNLVADLSERQRQAIWSGTATQFYQLETAKSLELT